MWSGLPSAPEERPREGAVGNNSEALPTSPGPVGREEGVLPVRAFAQHSDQMDSLRREVGPPTGLVLCRQLREPRAG